VTDIVAKIESQLATEETWGWEVVPEADLDALLAEAKRLRFIVRKLRQEAEGWYELPGIDEDAFERFHERYERETERILNGGEP
jgi:hypothetical protein